MLIKEEKTDEDFDYKNEKDLNDFCVSRLKEISERTLNMMLMEMRKVDRDRERIIHPTTLENLVKKYKLPITSCLPNLIQKFEDRQYPGYTNYEHITRWIK